TTRKFGGTGLGLVISRQIVEMMDGEICVESNLGKGSNFSFTVTFGSQLSIRKQEFACPPDLKEMRILVVDDNQTARDILCGLLESFSFHATPVDSGKDAIVELEKVSAENPYHLILMDYKMPGMNGLETSKRIKTNPRLNKIPAILMVTSYGREEIKEAAEEIGLAGFLNKPVNPSLLFDTIMNLFGKDIGDTSRLLAEKPMEVKGLELCRGARILLVEDNEINQQVATELLESEEFVVEIANNGQEAVDKIIASKAGKSFDVVLMDIQMPVMDGYTATKKIRALESDCRNIPIITMTAHAMAGEREKCLEATMNDYVPKPINPTELFSTLIKWIVPREQAIPMSKKKRFEKKESISFPETLAGIDIQSGLERVAGNEAMYQKILFKFKHNSLDMVDKIKEAIHTNDLDSARPLAHTIKGTSGNIGANKLFKAAGELESVLRNKQIEEIEATVKAFLNEFDFVIKTIGEFEEFAKRNSSDVTGPSQKNADQSGTFDLDHARSLLRDLMELLETDIPESKERLSALKELFANTKELARIKNIEVAIDNYDTEAAVESVNQIIENLGLLL
ncbi:response regulator, partial [bacterium]|nr:response regulator [bacterium]